MPRLPLLTFIPVFIEGTPSHLLSRSSTVSSCRHSSIQLLRSSLMSWIPVSLSYSFQTIFTVIKIIKNFIFRQAATKAPHARESPCRCKNQPRQQKKSCRHLTSAFKPSSRQSQALPMERGPVTRSCTASCSTAVNHQRQLKSEPTCLSGLWPAGKTGDPLNINWRRCCWMRLTRTCSTQSSTAFSVQPLRWRLI